MTKVEARKRALRPARWVRRYNAPMRRARPLATPRQRLTAGLWLGALLTFGALDTRAPWLLLPAASAFALAAGGAQARDQSVRNRRRVAGRCVRRGCDLRGKVSAVCPECGGVCAGAAG